jgi:hypothetical protein
MLARVGHHREIPTNAKASNHIDCQPESFVRGLQTIHTFRLSRQEKRGFNGNCHHPTINQVSRTSS